MIKNIELLENIMKPYFDKLSDLDNKKRDSLANIQNSDIDIEETRKKLEIELENLRVTKKTTIKDFQDNKEKDIENQLSKAFDTDSSFFASHGSVLRKDLKQKLDFEYDRKLQLIEKEFSIKESQIISELESLEIKNKKSEEFEEIKENVKKQMFNEQQRLNSRLLDLKSQQNSYVKTEFELEQQKFKYDEIIKQLSTFKFEYNDQNQVINSEEWRNLYQKSDLILEEIKKLISILSQENNVIEEIDDINKTLNKLQQYLNLIELTKEESNNLILEDVMLESIVNEDVVEKNVPIKFEHEIKDCSVITQDKENLLNTVYSAILNEINNLHTIKLNESKEKIAQNQRYISTSQNGEDYKLNGIIDLSDDETLKLPCGEYLNLEEVNIAIENLYNKTKGVTYIVKVEEKEYEISELTIKEFKTTLKKCSILKLIKDKKISKLDLLRVYGKEKTEKIIEEVETLNLNDINIPEGDYISRDELIAAIDILFITKKLYWLSNVSSKFNTTDLLENNCDITQNNQRKL